MGPAIIHIIKFVLINEKKSQYIINIKFFILLFNKFVDFFFKSHLNKTVIEDFIV